MEPSRCWSMAGQELMMKERELASEADIIEGRKMGKE